MTKEEINMESMKYREMSVKCSRCEKSYYVRNNHYDFHDISCEFLKQDGLWVDSRGNLRNPYVNLQKD